MRPSALPLLRGLQEAGALLGIITSRGSGSSADLADALHLASIAGHLDERHLYTSAPELQSLPATDTAKLVQLAGVRVADPGAVVLVVDDRDDAALLPGPDVVGVHLAEDERAHF